MKHLLTLLIICVSFNSPLLSQSCLIEGIRFGTQDEIDNFINNYPGCTEILGDVRINDFDPSGNLTNLSGLSVITSIGGNLDIVDNDFLNDLDGLQNLQSVGGDFAIGDNPLLINIDGFNKLTTLGGLLSIYNNLGLTSVNGFNGLHTIGDYFDLISNEALLQLNGFQNIHTINGQFQIEGNFMLDAINGFSNLQHIGSYVVIEDNTILTSLIGLSQLQSIGLSLRISNNNALNNLDPLNELTTIGTQCRIFANNNLSDCAIDILCDGGTQIGGPIDIFSNADGCQNLDQIIMNCIPNPNIEVFDNSISLLPSLTNNNLYVLSGSLNSYTIDILDSDGAIVQSIVSNETEELIDLTTLPNGMHFLRMINNTNSNLAIEVILTE